MNSSLATRSSQYIIQESNAPSNYIGTVLPEDLRVKLPERVCSLTGISESVLTNALFFCKCLPIVKVPDSVYEDEGDAVFYWKASDNGSVLVVVDDSFLHYFVREEDGSEVHGSDTEINERAGFYLRKFLPPHPSSKNAKICARQNKSLMVIA